MTVLLLVVGAVAYGVPVPSSTFPAFVLYVILGRFRWAPQSARD